MLDKSTQQPLAVSAGSDGRPYIMVPVEQLEALRKLLDSRQIRYEVDEVAVSIDDDPAMAFVNVWSGIDAESIRKMLAEAP